MALRSIPPLLVALLLLGSPTVAAAVSATDPAGDEWVHFLTPAGRSIYEVPVCHDPSLDILGLEADEQDGTIRVEVEHASAVLQPALTCAAAYPVQVMSQRYEVSIGSYNDDSHLILRVDASGACFYVFFTNPTTTSECVGSAEVDGVFIRAEAPAEGVATLWNGGTRSYSLEGTYPVHASNLEYAGPIPTLWPVGGGWAMMVGDYSDVDPILTVTP
jgi:hypothetical protein